MLTVIPSAATSLARVLKKPDRRHPVGVGKREPGDRLAHRAGAHVDDPSPTALAHPRQRRLDQDSRRQHQRSVGLLPLAQRVVERPAERRPAGVGDQDLDGARALLYLGGQVCADDRGRRRRLPGRPSRPRSRRPPPRAPRASGSPWPPWRPRGPAPRRSPCRSRGLRPSPGRSSPRCRGPSWGRYPVPAAGAVGYGAARWPATATSTSSWSTRRTPSTARTRTRRALHAKGTWCEGSFTASPEAAQLCRALHFQGDPVPALVRFSNGSGNPESNDAEREARGMAVKLRPEAGTRPTFSPPPPPPSPPGPPRSSSSFCASAARIPRPASPTWRSSAPFSPPTPSHSRRSRRRSTPSLLRASPSSPTARRIRSSSSTPPARAPGSATAGVRRRARLRSPTTRPASAAATTFARSSRERLRAGPAAFELLFQIAAEGDPIDDPTAIWPEDRELVVAGRLEITEIVDDPEADDHIDVFDPIRVVDGIELSNDPILHARARAYSVSAYRRLGVEVESPSTPPTAPG